LSIMLLPERACWNKSKHYANRRSNNSNDPDNFCFVRGFEVTSYKLHPVCDVRNCTNDTEDSCDYDAFHDTLLLCSAN